MKSVTLAAEAAIELRDARDWYNDRRSGLGSRFVDDVRGALFMIQARPEACPNVERGYRRRVLQRFPYAIVYRVDDDQITIIAIWHTSRDATVLRDRLR